MRQNHIVISISRFHRKATVWEGAFRTHLRIGVHTCKPVAGLSEGERKKAIATWLWVNWQIAL